MNARALLLVQLHHLGDVLLAAPAVRAARRAFPDARIDFVTGSAGAAALEGNPHLDHVHRFGRGVRRRLQLLRTLHAGCYDAVVDFHSQPTTAQLVAATRARVRIGLVGRGPRNLAYTRLLPRERGPVYMALQKLRMLAPLGVAAQDADLRLEVVLSAEDHAFARDVYARHGLEGAAPVVAVSAVSRHAFKQWGAARWAALSDRLMAAGARVLLTHGPGEEDQVSEVLAYTKTAPVHGYGGTTIKQLAALYARATLWVGNDGGPKHLAAAAGTPTISVVRWGLGPVWSDLRPGSGQQAFDPAPRQGCDRACEHCAHIGCLGAVTVDEVADAALRHLHALDAAAVGTAVPGKH